MTTTCQSSAQASAPELTAARAERPTGPALSLAAAKAHIASLALRDRSGGVGTVGLELESHLVDLREPGARVPWQRILDTVAGLDPMPTGSTVTLEPGGQVELSGPPLPGIVEAVAGMRRDEASLRAQLRMQGLGLATLGADPARPVRRGHTGARYAAMDAHFRATGTGGAGLAMMCSTASIQLNLDAGPADRWSERVALAHALGPVMVAVSACSPLLSGRVTGWCSSRQRIWDELDEARCGPLLGGEDPASEWASYALAAPVMLIRHDDNGASPALERTPFRDWINGAELAGRTPTLADLDYHLTTLFPPVRLRGFLEIRYLDAAPTRWWPALVATLATLMDVPEAAAQASELVAPVSRSWTAAARDGLGDPALKSAAAACLGVALGHCPPELRSEITSLAALVESGRSPGDEVLDHARLHGPLSALIAEAVL